VVLKCAFDLCAYLNILHRIAKQIAYHANSPGVR
jgi:hypothetical protein